MGLRYAYSILVGNPEEKRLLGRHKHNSEDNIRMKFREIAWEIVDLINLTKDRKHWRGHVNTGSTESGECRNQLSYY